MIATQKINSAVIVLGSIFGMLGVAVCIISLVLLGILIVDGGRPEYKVESELQRCCLRSNVVELETGNT